MATVGRISGPLLKSNLIRNGIDLAFETDLLYLDVNNNRLGIKTATPGHELEVIGTSRTTNLEVDTSATIADITISGNTIESANTLNLLTTGSDTVIYQRQLDVQSVSIFDNVISTNESNANLELRPNGTGTLEVFSNLNVDGNIYASGNITADGTVTIGDADTDNVVFNADINSSIIPDQDNAYTLGTAAKRWADIYVNTFTAENVDTGDLFVDGVDLNLRQGNIIYVATNGDDAHTGTHQNDPVATIGRAIAISSAGDTIHVYPGTYTEQFPLELPVGVSVRGESLRSVNIRPTTETRYNDAFLMNGETTVEDVTVSGFYSGGNFFEVTNASAGSTTVNVGTAPFAHTYVSGGTVNIAGTDYAITGATYTHTTGVLVVTHATGTATVGQDVFIKNLTFSCNNDTRVFPDNGYAFRFATNFTVTSRSPYLKNITVITEGTVKTASDPRGFDSGDAGKGVYVDGAYATALSKEAAMLFHSVTFICPGVDGITATNGARIEWLNSFTYFSNRSIYAFDSNDGLRGDGKTALRVDDVTGTFSAGETITYYDTDGTTVLATGTIESIDSGKILLDTKITGWELPSERVGKTVTANGDAQIDSTISKFGIGSLILDGTGDYLSIASTDDFAFGTNDFTIEAYVYKTADTGQETIFDFRTVASDTAVAIGVRTGNQPYVYVNGTYEIQSATALTLSAWNHVAYVRQGTTGTLYLNGTSVGTWVDNTNYASTKPLIIGAGYTGGFTFWTGNIDEVRVINGTAKYTANFTPSTTPFLSEEETVLLLHFDDISGSTTIVDDGIAGQDIRFSSGATANKFTLVDFSDFGAEIRLIGSASVYGNFGLVGDGPGVIMYAIGYNVAYIGNGKAVDNDPTTVLQQNEVVDTDNAKIYYSTVDHKGDFRVGDLFVIDQENGAIQFSNASFNIDTTNGIEITDGTSTTLIKGDKIETGNIRVSGNTVETLSGDMNLTAASNNINLQNDVNITGNLDVTGDVEIAGNITIGDQSTDTVSFVANIDSGMFPKVTDTYDLGSPSLRWRDLWANRMYIDSIEINDNFIQTVDSNANLELRANGTGIVLIPSNNVTIQQDLTVNGDTSVVDLTVNDDLTVTGTLTTTGNIDVTGSVSISDTLSVGNTTQFENIKIDQNYIETTLSNSDLELRANGTGEILVPNNDVTVQNNLDVGQTITANNLTVNNNITTDQYTNGDIEIDNNVIQTTLPASDLTLQSTGNVVVPTNDVILQQNLTVDGTSTFNSDVNVNGAVTHIGDLDQTGNTIQTGNFDLDGDLTVTSDAQFEDIRVAGNVLSTTLSNSDLELRANGTGVVLVPSNDVRIENDLLVVGTTNVADLTASGLLTTNSLTNGDITINGNIIETTLSNSDLTLRAAGAGTVLFDTNNVFFQQALNVVGLSTLTNTQINGQLTQLGSTVQTGDYTLTGNFNITGFLNVDNTAQFENIQIDQNVITTTLSNSDLELRANGAGNVIIPNNDVIISNNLIVDGLTSITELTVTGNVIANSFTTGDVLIDDNFITTTTSNSNLELRASGTGEILIDQNNLQVDNDLTVSGITSLTDTNITGLLTHTGNTLQTGDYDITGNLSVTGILDIQSAVQLEEILIDDNFITTTTSNTDLELRAAGTGEIIIPNNNLTVSNTANISTINSTDISNAGTVTSGLLSTGDIEITGNTIATTQSNSNLNISAAGTGLIQVNNGTDVSITDDLTVNGITQLSTTIINGTLTHIGNLSQTGNSIVNGNVTVNGIFDVNNTAQFENIKIDQNYITTTVSNSDLELRAAGTGEVLIPTNDVTISNNLNVDGLLSSNGITNTGTVFSDIFDTSDIRITGSTITTLVNNLTLSANGVGNIVIPAGTNITASSDLTVQGLTTLGNTQITGTVTHTGNVTQTGDIDITGNLVVNGELTVTNFGQFEDIRIEQNFITTTLTNSNLELDANGIGIINVPNNNVEFGLDLTVLGTINSGAIVNTGNLTSTTFDTGDIEITGNTITTTQSNSNLVLRASGTGIIEIPNNDVLIDNNLTVQGLTTLENVNINQSLVHTGDTTQTGNFDLNGVLDVSGQLTIDSSADISDIRISGNVIESTAGDLRLEGNGTGNISIVSNDVVVTNNLTQTAGTTFTNQIQNALDIVSSQFYSGAVLISGNSISNYQGSTLNLSTSGTGVISANADVQIVNGNNLTVTGNTFLQDITANGTVTHTGNYNQTGDTNITGNLNVSGNFDATGLFQFEEILIDDNFITTTTSNADLELRANGTGQILIPNNDVSMLGDLTVGETLTAGDITSFGSVQSSLFDTGDIQISGNLITTTLSNSNLELRAAGAGSIDFGTISVNENIITVTDDLIFSLGTGQIVEFASTESLVIPSGTELERPITPQAGMLRFNTDINDFEGYNGTGWSGLGGVFDDDRDTFITAELTPGANDGVIRFYTNGALAASLDSTGLETPRIEIDNILIENNTISAVNTNTDLSFQANGTGSVVLENFEFSGSTITNTSASNTEIVQNGTGYFKFGDAEGFVLPIGTSAERPAVPQTGVTRFNTTDSRVEVYDGQNWVSVAGSASGISRADAENLAFEIVLSLG